MSDVDKTEEEVKREVFLEKFHNWFLKDLPLDRAINATDFLISHLGKAQKLHWESTYGYDEAAKTTYPTMHIIFTYLENVNGTVVELPYCFVLDMSKQS